MNQARQRRQQMVCFPKSNSSPSKFGAAFDSHITSILRITHGI